LCSGESRIKVKTDMKNLRMKCPYCGYWNRFPVDKIFIEQPSQETKVKVLIPVYKPLETSKCKKCGKIIAEPKELIRITKSCIRDHNMDRRK